MATQATTCEYTEYIQGNEEDEGYRPCTSAAVITVATGPSNNLRRMEVCGNHAIRVFGISEKEVAT